MATTESNKAEIDVLNTQLAELLSKSVLPQNMTATQRKAIQDSLYPIINGMNTDKIPNGNYTIHEIGDIAWKVDNASKRYSYGRVLDATFNGSDVDIDNANKFDLYQNNKIL